MPRQTGFCDTCYSIANELQSYYESLQTSFREKVEPDRHRKDKKISLGTMKDLESRSECQSCQDIVCKLVKDGTKTSVLCILYLDFDQHQGLCISPESWLEKPLLKLWRLGCPTTVYEVGRLFDPQQIDLNLLSQWINHCLASHGNGCSRSELSIPLPEILLIDVEEGCLTSMGLGTQYVALSYVWGHCEALKLTKSNLMHLKKSRSIDIDIGNVQVTNTVRDAMRLVSLLGEKYLWVDCLCIVQDELDTKQLYLNSMASIYANAYFTIVAADGPSADHGLRGFEQNSHARTITCDTVRFPCGLDMIVHRPLAPCEDSPWESRAWTFQEALFSRRILIFNGTISWYCRRALWREYVRSPTEDTSYQIPHNRHYGGGHLVASIPTWPDLESWADMVREFNKRKLTYDEDVINAFSGVASVFNSRFSGGILWGIPEMFFDHCIVWKSRKVLRRRANGRSLSESPFPSWSWVSWEGDIHLVGAPLILNNHPRLDGQTVHVQPISRWFKSGKPSPPLSLVKNIYPRLRQIPGRILSQRLPIGWSQGEYTDGIFYYTHDSVPSERFRFPIPLNNKDTNPLFDDNGRYLHFKSQRATLFIGQEKEQIFDDWTACLACLEDKEGNWAGTIQLNTPKHALSLKGQPCELIALSLAMADNKGDYFGLLDEWKMPERPKDSEFYLFYYVMWIEWENAIAYRKAVGTVYKTVWEKQVREDVDIVLG